MTQGEFLSRLGIEQRAAALMRKCTPEQGAEIAAAQQRLTAMGEREMGSLFKVLVFAQPGLAAPAGFEGDAP